MDEDDNISNADISIDEEDDDDDEQEQQHPQQQQPQQQQHQHHIQQQQSSSRRRSGNRDRIDLVQLQSYRQQFQLANVASSSSSSTSSSTTSADSGAARTVAAEAGAAGNSPFHDWDTQQSSAARSGNSNTGSGLQTNSEELNDAGAGNAGAKPTFFFSTSSFILRSRKDVAALINTECCRGSPTPDLDSIMDTLFNPGTPIDNPDNIEWIRWLIAGGRTPKEFVKIGKYKK